jgi:hypothetical protein
MHGAFWPPGEQETITAHRSFCRWHSHTMVGSAARPLRRRTRCRSPRRRAAIARNRSGLPYSKDTLGDDFGEIRGVLFPGDKGQLADLFRSGALEVDAGGATDTHLSNKDGRSCAGEAREAERLERNPHKSVTAPVGKCYSDLRRDTPEEIIGKSTTYPTFEHRKSRRDSGQAGTLRPKPAVTRPTTMSSTTGRASSRNAGTPSPPPSAHAGGASERGLSVNQVSPLP